MKPSKYKYRFFPEPVQATPSGDCLQRETTFRLYSSQILNVLGYNPHWVSALNHRVAALFTGDLVLPWQEWRQGLFPSIKHGDPPKRLLDCFADSELLTRLSRARAQLMWLNLRRQRLYSRPTPLYLYDVGFCRWLHSVDELTVRTWVVRYIGAYAEHDARSQLALLRPMPLELLWRYHEHVCQLTNAVAGCDSIEDIALEYAVIFSALHTCRFLSEAQRHMPLNQTLWTRQSIESGELQRTEFLAQEDLQGLRPSVVDRFVSMSRACVVEAACEAVEPAAVFSAPCANCLRYGRDKNPAFAFPPFSIVCDCKVLFDPEHDPLREAPYETDVKAWLASEREWSDPGMRVLLRAMEVCYAAEASAPAEAANLFNVMSTAVRPEGNAVGVGRANKFGPKVEARIDAS